MNRFFYILTFIIFFQSYTTAQDSLYYTRIVKTLCSDSLYGRGYVHNGTEKAAAFIVNEFKDWNLEPLSPNYRQIFSIPVNTFPNDITVSINGNSLLTGKDYIIDPQSSSIKGNFKAKHIHYTEILDGLDLSKIKLKKNEIVVIDNRIPNSEKQKNIYNGIILDKVGSAIDKLQCVIINTNDKLLWNVAYNVIDGVIITLENYNSPIDNVSLSIENTFIPNYKLSNIIACKPGTMKDSVIVFAAHYDHLGMLGNAIFPGANDNASGVAMLLELAQFYSTQQPKYTMVFIAFAAEEVGIVGSRYYVNNPVFPLKHISFLWNFDLAGTGDKGIQVVNSTSYEREFHILDSLNNRFNLLSQIKKRGKACNSDHCPFDQAGVKTFYSYTLGGIDAYHSIYDKYETLPFTEFEDYLQLIKLFIDNY